MDSNAELPTEGLTPPVEVASPAAPESRVPGENPPWNGWDVLRIAVIQFLIPYVVIIPIAVLVAQKTIYRGMTFQQVAVQKLWISLCTQFAWYAVVAVYMVMFVEGTYRQRF